jgi:hypothetical protein
MPVDHDKERKTRWKAETIAATPHRDGTVLAVYFSYPSETYRQTVKQTDRPVAAETTARGNISPEDTYWTAGSTARHKAPLDSFFFS